MIKVYSQFDKISEKNTQLRKSNAGQKKEKNVKIF